MNRAVFDTFHTDKPILGMLHLNGGTPEAVDRLARREISQMYENGVTSAPVDPARVRRFMDAVEVAGGLGISADKAVNYRADAVGTATNFDALGQAASAVRGHGSVGSSWRGKIDKDYNERK